MVPQVISEMAFNQSLQRLEIFPERWAPLATASLMLQVARDKEPKGICNVRIPTIIYMLHDRMVLIPCIGIEHSYEAQIDPQYLIEFQHLFA